MKNKNNLFRLLKMSKPYSLWLGLGALLSVLAVAVNISLPSIYKQVVDTVMEDGHQASFNHYVRVIIVLLVISTLLVFARKWVSSKFSLNTLANIKNTVVRHLQYTQVQSLNQYHSGDLGSRMNGDIELIRKFLVEVFEFIYQPIVFLVAVTFGLLLSWKLLLSTMMILSLALVLSTIVSKPLSELSVLIQSQFAKCSGFIQETIQGIHVVKSNQLEDHFKQRFDQFQGEVYFKEMSVVKQQVYLMAIITLIMILPIQVINIYGGRLAFMNEMSMGEFTAFLAIIHFLVSPVERFIQLMGNLNLASGAATRIVSVLDIPIENSVMEKFTLDVKNPSVEFKNVSYSYNKSINKGLQDISFIVDGQKMVVIVGESGSGKSTILNLLCGFMKPDCGEIRLFDENTHSKLKTDVRRKISYVSQHPYIYPKSVAENIGIGNKKASREEIVLAAMKANAHEFIINLPDGYDTLLLENGANLSGGQKQRISIARALLKDADVLLLDEPTSALDPENEHHIMYMLKHLSKTKTVILVTHRLSFLELSDTCVVMNQGRIVSQGKHEELLHKDDYYKRMYSLANGQQKERK